MYQGSDNHSEGYQDSDTNQLATVNARKYTTVTNQC